MEFSTEEIENMKKEGFTYEEIQSILDSENEFEKTWIVYSHEYAKKIAREKIFSNMEKYV